MIKALLLNQRVFLSKVVIPSFLLCWSGLLWASSPSDAKNLLERMTSALQEQSYSGVFVYRRQDELTAMKVTHLANQHGAQEFLETLTGEEREINRSTRQLGAVSRDVSVDELVSARLEGIENFYELSIKGVDRVAGRPATLLAVGPRDEFRYGYRLWIDEETGLLLKSDLLSGSKILEQVMFTSLELLPEKIAEAQTGGAESTDPVLAEQVEDAIVWAFDDMPKGFRLADATSKGDQGAVQHLIYTDGLASVSIFVEPIGKEESSFVGVSRMGAVNAYGQISSGFQVTVVGEVPEVTVRAIGQSIRNKKAVSNRD